MITTYRLALIGFGTVGRGLAEILRDKGDTLAQHYGARFVITAVSTAGRGCVSDPHGIAPALLLGAAGTQSGLRSLPFACDWDALRVIEEAQADIVVETTWTNLEDAEPATTYLRRALQRGLHVVTANKGPIALHYHELTRLATEQDRFLGFEGTVMAGTPALRLGWSALAGCVIDEILGILNGTTNFILTAMEAGRAYEDALLEAQRLGYAEADPVGDVEGYDAAAKVAILANVLFGAELRPGDVERQGITRLTPEDIARALAAGERWKLIGRLRREGKRMRASVRPERLPISHPLAFVSGTTNAITYSTDLLGPVTLIGLGAGGRPTGFALLSDLLEIHRRWSK